MIEHCTSARTLAVVLAGGAGRRFGGDKPLRALLSGRSLVAHVVDRLAAQGLDVAINANDHAEAYAEFGHPVFDDGRNGQKDGPLAGLLASMDFAIAHGYGAVLTAPGDSPFLPTDLYARLSRGTGPAVAASAGRLHPVVGYWPIDLREILYSTFHERQVRRIATFVEQINAMIVEWSTDPIDPFMDVDDAQDLMVVQSHYDRLNGVVE